MSGLTILDAINDRSVFARWFRDRSSWAAWFAFFAALFALPMTDTQAAVYRQCTGRQSFPERAFTEAFLICGRRSGKSFVLAVIAVFVACFRDWRPFLQPGERATVMIIAADRKQARAIFRYIKGLLTEVPMLARLVERETAEAFDLANFVTIEIGTASFKRTRGYAICVALLDELAFYPTENSASPDTEIINAIRPGMAQFRGQAMMLCASSPYVRRGVLWDAFSRYHGNDQAPALVWKAATRTMNPSVPQKLIDEEFQRDPAHARAEFMAEFRSDIESFVSRDAVIACVDDAVIERPHDRRFRYVAFTDVAGGSGSDSFTLAIAHRAGDTGVLDLVREIKPPFSPEAIVSELCETLRRYRVARVIGDRFGGEWPREQFRKYGVHYILAEHTRSELYGALLPLINSGAVALLENDRLITQLVCLERRVTKAGRQIIDHPASGKDDLANSAAGALINAFSKPAHSSGETQRVSVAPLRDPLSDFHYGDLPGHWRPEPMTDPLDSW